MDDLEDLLKEAMARTLPDDKVCSKCDTLRSITQFSWASLSKADKRDGVRRRKAQCKFCDSADFTKWRRENLTEVQLNDRAKHYTRKYGLDKELSLVLADAQNRVGVCPLCRKKAQLVLDHDHATGAVRDLICTHCNTLLGYAKESLDTLYNAIVYLKKHKGV